MATAKQVFYNQPLALLPKRKDNARNLQHPSLTVTIPFTFSTRLSRLEDRRLKSAASIRRSRATSLPRLTQPSAKPSIATSRSNTTTSGSVPKRVESGEATTSLVSEEVVGAMVCEVEEIEQEELSPEEEREKRLTDEKCLKWLQGLPSKFSAMHVVQHVVYNGDT